MRDVGSFFDVVFPYHPFPKTKPGVWFWATPEGQRSDKTIRAVSLRTAGGSWGKLPGCPSDQRIQSDRAIRRAADKTTHAEIARHSCKNTSHMDNDDDDDDDADDTGDDNGLVVDEYVMEPNPAFVDMGAVVVVVVVATRRW